MTVPWRRLPWSAIAMVIGLSALSLLTPPRRERPFHVPGEAEAIMAQALFGRALTTGSADRKLQSEARRMGLAAAPIADPAGLALTEPPGRCTGRGAYLLRAGSSSPVALVAPHRNFDRHTGEIALELFRAGDFAAVAWNSAPRRGDKNCPYAGDVAQERSHYITAFSLAFAHHHPDGLIVQLHGFAQARHAQDAAGTADAILSNGSRRMSTRIDRLADCLARAFPERRILRFPEESGVLGATRNAQGKALRAAGFDGFVHLELSEGFRATLRTDLVARTALSDCLRQEQ